MCNEARITHISLLIDEKDFQELKLKPPTEQKLHLTKPDTAL